MTGAAANVQRAVIVDGWKYIATYRWVPPAERAEAIRLDGEPRERPDLWGPVVRRELFRLTEDPLETTDLAAQHPDKLRQLEQELERYRLHCETEGLEPPRGDEAESPLSREQEERLRALGYSDG